MLDFRAPSCLSAVRWGNLHHRGLRLKGSHALTILAQLSGHTGRAAAGAGGGVAGAPVQAAAGQAAVHPEGAGRASWGEREMR